MGSDGIDFEEAVRKLAREFEKREMVKHVNALREFYARVLVPERKGRADSWPVSFVLEWMANFQIPPMEKHSPCSHEARVVPTAPGIMYAGLDLTRLTGPGSSSRVGTSSAAAAATANGWCWSDGAEPLSLTSCLRAARCSTRRRLNTALASHSRPDSRVADSTEVRV